MIWQDLVIGICNSIFIYSLSNQVYYGFKNKIGTITLITSGFTTLGLYVMSVTFITLDLYFSGFMLFLTGSLWATLFVQRLKYKKI
jgi:hypothetical protein